MYTHFLNGAFVTEKELLISPRDLGFTRGYAIFDFLKTYPHHRAFGIDEHIQRLFNSARLIDLELPWSKEEVKQRVLETLDRNSSPDEKFIKIIVSGGVSNSMLPQDKPTLVILIDPAVEYPKEHYEKGVGVITVEHDRYTPEAKSNNYIEGVKQTQRAHAMGAVEPVYYSDTQVFEGSNSNIFALIDGRLLTPKSRILEGVTRYFLLKILKLDVPVVAEDFSLQDLLGANEVFLTGSGKEITPVTKIDGKPVGNGEVGPITKEAMRQYAAYTRSDSW